MGDVAFRARVYLVVSSLCVFLLATACGGSDDNTDICTSDPCGSWCGLMDVCEIDDPEWDCMEECSQMGENYQWAYCICHNRLYDKYGCDPGENDEIAEQELSTCMQEECEGCVL